MSGRCVVLLGGSFDPVHNGHVALGGYFVKLLLPDELRIIPAGNPWQKSALHASPEHRVEMVRRGFESQPVPVVIDSQEIDRTGPSYTVESLQAIRRELGPQVSLVFLMGADQLRKLDTWKHWRQLFEFANICVASRPGFSLGNGMLPAEVAEQFARRAATPDQIRNTPAGLTYVASNLAINISSSEVRLALRQGTLSDSLIPPTVLDYIKQHHLYQN